MVANLGGCAIGGRQWIHRIPGPEHYTMNTHVPGKSALLLLALAMLAGAASARAELAVGERVPGFPSQATGDWLNTDPLVLAELRGRPVLIEFWTFGCVNCLRTVPWLREVAQTYQERGLVVVSVHTPEFPQEGVAANVRRAVERLRIDYPVLLDPEARYWNALGNRYWPAFYLLDDQGRLAATAIGEMHVGTQRARRFEQEIEAQLARQ